MAAHLALTQGVVVQVHDPVPYGPLVKMVKTPAPQAGGVEFKSHRGHQHVGVAQPAEQRIDNPQAKGPNPFSNTSPYQRGFILQGSQMVRHRPHTP